MSATLAELSKVSGARLVGDPECVIDTVNTLGLAETGEITFLSNRHYANLLVQTKASAVILSEDDLENCPTNALVTNTPYLVYAKIANYLYPDKQWPGAISEYAIIGQKSIIDKSSTISANVVIGDNVVINAGTYIGPGCVIADNVTIGKNTMLFANITLCHDVTIGNDVILHPGVVIGADGFGLAQENGQWLKIPQIGSVTLGDCVEVGANTTIDRGAIGDTIISDGVKIDNQVQIGHNAFVGENTAIAGCVALAGSASIGKRCQIGGASSINGHIVITDDVIITGMSGVANSIKSPGVYSSAIPVTDNKTWKRNIIRFKNLDKIIKKIMFKLE
ncbi:MAG: UDP-3-O-[3-hydroxymyristoyl] glucosamine N-acyltransferase [Gammaproteobacteria bacterium]|jgi:UDP-3-O-[3-hydroxymyristoyl] glucosamine N-acyltransferase